MGTDMRFFLSRSQVVGGHNAHVLPRTRIDGDPKADTKASKSRRTGLTRSDAFDHLELIFSAT